MRSHRVLMFSLTVAVVVGAGSWARRAALEAGLWADDYAQVAMLDGTYPSQRAAWDLFHFLDDRADDHQRLVDFGAFPWWTHPHFRLSMLRPLPSLSTALDYQFFHVAGKPQHIHSLLWWVALVVAAGSVLYQLFTPLTAAMALLIFSLDESHTVPVLWLANRSALMATAFNLAALATHLRWREDARRRGWRVASIGLAALSFACGEYAFATLGYVFSFELLRPRIGVTRVRALAPFILTALVFLVVSTAMGYGSAHSALYTSPFSAPIDYAAKVWVGVPVLMAELVLGVPADWWSFGSPWPQQLNAALSIDSGVWDQLPSWKTCQLTLGAVSVAIIIAALRWLRYRLGQKHHLSLVCLMCGAALSLLPSMGSFITTRLALPASLAFAALYASALSVVFEAIVTQGKVARAPAEGIGLALLAAAIVYVHGYRAFVQTEAGTSFFSLVARSRTHWALSAIVDERKPPPRMIMIASADANDAAYTAFVRSAHGRRLVSGLRILSAAPGSHAITRVDDRTLDLRLTDEFGLSSSVAASFTRSESDILTVGDRVQIAGMDVTILQTHQGQPTHMRFRFDVSLESDRLAFVHSTPGGLVALALPAVGATMHVPAPTMPNLMLMAAP